MDTDDRTSLSVIYSNSYLYVVDSMYSSKTQFLFCSGLAGFARVRSIDTTQRLTRNLSKILSTSLDWTSIFLYTKRHSKSFLIWNLMMPCTIVYPTWVYWSQQQSYYMASFTKDIFWQRWACYRWYSIADLFIDAISTHICFIDSMINMNQGNLENVLESIAMIAICYLAASMIHQNRAQFVSIARTVKTFIYHPIQNITTLMVTAATHPLHLPIILIYIFSFLQARILAQHFLIYFSKHFQKRSK